MFLRQKTQLRYKDVQQNTYKMYAALCVYDYKLLRMMREQHLDGEEAVFFTITACKKHGIRVG